MKSVSNGREATEIIRTKSVKVQTDQSEYEKNFSHCLQVLVIWATTGCPSNDEAKIIAEALAQLVMIQTSGNGKLWRIGEDNSMNRFFRNTLPKSAFILSAIQDEVAG